MSVGRASFTGEFTVEQLEAQVERLLTHHQNRWANEKVAEEAAHEKLIEVSKNYQPNIAEQMSSITSYTSNNTRHQDDPIDDAKDAYAQATRAREDREKTLAMFYRWRVLLQHSTGKLNLTIDDIAFFRLGDLDGINANV